MSLRTSCSCKLMVCVLMIAFITMLYNVGGGGPFRMSSVLELILGAIVFVPALVVIPIGLGAVIGAFVGNVIVRRDEASFSRYASGFRMAAVSDST